MPRDERFGPGGTFSGSGSTDGNSCRPNGADLFSRKGRLAGLAQVRASDSPSALPASTVPSLRRIATRSADRSAEAPDYVAPGGTRARFRRAAMALAALDTERRIGIFRYLAARSPALVLPRTIAQELGITVRTAEAELARLLAAGLVHAHGHGPHKAFSADNARARDCLDLIHALAHALGTV